MQAPTKEADSKPLTTTHRNKVRVKQHLAIVKIIADRLGEMHSRPRWQIHLILRSLGAQTTLQLFQETLTIEDQGGMFLPDGKKRTPGGIFFHLAKQRYGDQLPPVFYGKRKAATL
jgi:hypothetical protein